MGVLGKCPKCGADVVGGKYGPYCSNKCGMYLSKAFGKDLTEDQVSNLLQGKKVLLKGLVSRNPEKKQDPYDMYIEPDGVEDYSYTNKNGEEKSGSRFKFKTSFPEKKKKDDEGVDDRNAAEPTEAPALENFEIDTGDDEELPFA